ncbi:unnamed protein product [Arctia plantaginis]|uniref:Uncharacterized protein n=1 Tax=Arctia plantaginis TaxID=874455 RepID=A0A8S0ZB10_ARCPL|nr:unnamed protein product [Arctia plantaginis]
MTQSLKVWSKFSTNKESGVLNFQIVDAPRDRTEDVAELIFHHFMTGESISKAADSAKRAATTVLKYTNIQEL